MATRYRLLIGFATSNKLKLQEAAVIIPEIVPLTIHIPELQEIDVAKVVAEKLLIVAQAGIDHTVIVEDTGLYLDTWNGLPGALIRWFIDTMGTRRLAEIALAADNVVVARAVSAVGVWHAGQSAVFTGSTTGKIVMPRGEEMGWNSIFFYPELGKTFGEMTFEERLSVSMRRAPLIEARAWVHSNTTI